MVEGRLAVEALLDSRSFHVESVLLEEDRHELLRVKLLETGTEFRIGSRKDLQSEAGYDFHRGVLAWATKPDPQEASEDELRIAHHLVFPVGLADPGNLGTVVRNGVAFGADAIVVERDRGADIWSRKAIRASATGVFRVPVYAAVDAGSFIERARKCGFVIFGTSLSNGARPLEEVDPARQSLLLLGTEKDGLSQELERLCDELVRIPMRHGMDSINVGSSSAIMCHHLFQANAL